MSKLNVAVVCGGYSGEAVISIQSTDLVLNHLSPDKYNIFKVELSKEGWKVFDSRERRWEIHRSDFSIELENTHISFDVVINMIHGTPGEDGQLQGYFEMLNIPYNNSDVLCSALTFNKGFCNQYLSKNGIDVAESVLLQELSEVDVQEIISKLGLPCFVKPNDGGSSIGVTKVKEESQLEPAITKAFKEATRVLIESFVEGTEITCGVVEWNNEITPLAVTEIDFDAEFFDFDAKYVSAATREITPARISEKDYNTAMKMSVQIFKILGCKGFFRADYIIKNGKMYLIEVNTVPGMSAKSLMPQQLEYAGIPLSEVLDQQIAKMLR